MPSSFRKRLLDLKKRFPGGVLRFEVPLDSLRSPDGVVVTGDWKVALEQGGKTVEKAGMTGEDALEAVELEA
jgi:hypothetical protein